MGISALAMNQAEADKLAQVILDKHTSTFVQAEGRCYGQPELKAGCVVDVKSLGTRFNGKYLVTSATHEWDTRHDYVTRFYDSRATWRDLARAVGCSAQRSPPMVRDDRYCHK